MQIIRRGLVTSTMDECRALYAAGAPELTVVVADAQTDGRGRAGRTWFSPAGSSIYVSALLRPQVDPKSAGRLMMLGALCVLDAIECTLQVGVRSGIKWPNDVLIDGRKVAGVLVESSLFGDCVEYCVLGIGLNVYVDFMEAPGDVRARACSLHEYASGVVDREIVLTNLLSALEQRYEQFRAAPRDVVGEYRARLLTLGAEVRTLDHGELVHGCAVSVDDDGALSVQTSTGVRVLRFGDLA